jgi:hypothetical protein
MAPLILGKPQAFRGLRREEAFHSDQKVSKSDQECVVWIRQTG